MDEEPNGNDVIHLVGCAARNDIDGAAEALDSIAKRGGTRALYATTCGIAEAFIRMTDMLPGPDEFVGLEMLGREVGAEVAIWAGRFVTAHANRDFDQTMALFLAAKKLDADPANPIELVDRICMVLSWAAQAVQAKAAS
jgi:hypothetical protein